MSLSELLPAVIGLSHQDKLRLIHFLLLAIAKEEGCNLELRQQDDLQNNVLSEQLLEQMASTEAVVWSPQADQKSVQALANLLAKESTRA